MADDHPVVRNGVKFQLEPSRFNIIGEANNGFEACDLCAEKKPDLLIMDISMPGKNGLESAALIRQTSPQTKIILLSMHKNPEYFKSAKDLQVSGYVLKDDPITDWNQLLGCVLAGKKYVSEAVLETYQAYLNNTSQEKSHLDALTKREREILELIIKGKSSKTIAVDLFLSIRTVETHRQNMMRKLQVHDLASLVRIGLQHKSDKSNN